MNLFERKRSKRFIREVSYLESRRIACSIPETVTGNILSCTMLRIRAMDCRYCHSFVEVAAHSNLPTTQVCMNCHQGVQKENPKLAPLHESWRTGKPIEWVQIHKTPDYVYFNHAAHVNRGVSCVSCHGRVDKMDVVYHAESHSMSWCLDCHRAPENALRPLDKITDLGWQAPLTKDQTPKEAQLELGLGLKKKWHINPPDKNCAGCHR